MPDNTTYNRYQWGFYPNTSTIATTSGYYWTSIPVKLDLSKTEGGEISSLNRFFLKSNLGTQVINVSPGGIKFRGMLEEQDNED